MEHILDFQCHCEWMDWWTGIRSWLYFTILT